MFQALLVEIILRNIIMIKVLLLSLKLMFLPNVGASLQTCIYKILFKKKKNSKIFLKHFFD